MAAFPATGGGDNATLFRRGKTGSKPNSIFQIGEKPQTLALDIHSDSSRP
jgi:hypothetical protein